MHKTLPANFKDKTSEENDAVKTKERQKTLKNLILELKPHLDEVKKDLLQPRQKMVDELLKKALD